MAGGPPDASFGEQVTFEVADERRGTGENSRGAINPTYRVPSLRFQLLSYRLG